MKTVKELIAMVEEARRNERLEKKEEILKMLEESKVEKEIDEAALKGYKEITLYVPSIYSKEIFCEVFEDYGYETEIQNNYVVINW